MQIALDCLAEGVRSFLGHALPSVNDNWWQNCVLVNLSFQQERFVEERNINSLDGLDLAGVLRTLDRNWFELSDRYNLSREARSWLKEAQLVRNRWAHRTGEPIQNEDKYRDIDTVWRLMYALKVEEHLLKKVAAERDAALTPIMPNSAKQEQTKTPSKANSSAEIAIGSIVEIIAEPDIEGAVTEVIEDTHETRYRVFINGALQIYYRSQIRPREIQAEERALNIDELNAMLTALQISNPDNTHLYSLHASRIDFIPYQFRPVVKLIQSDRPRLLIADEVGVGKTIEAGLILKELQARSDINSVLVICPKPLVAERKWQDELKRFDEDFVHLNGTSLRYCIDEMDKDGVWPERYSKVILPFSLLDESLFSGNQTGRARRIGLVDLDPPPVFDLVIVDEAHHARNTNTWRHKAVRYFCDNAEAVVLLTATPVQLHDNDLFNLLSLLRPDLLPSRQAFEQMAEPNLYINAAVEVARAAASGWQNKILELLKKALATAWGRGVLNSDPRVQDIYDLVGESETDVNSRLRVIRLLEGLYTFSTLINRTRRRDIGTFTTRKPETVQVDFTESQAKIHEELLGLIARILEYKHGTDNLRFMLSMVRRQLSSCVYGLAPFMESMLNRHLSAFDFSEVDGTADFEEYDRAVNVLGDFRQEVKALITKVQNLDGKDPKYDAFLKVVKDKQHLDNNKLLVFSSFRHTLAYLIKKISTENLRVGLIHGDVSDEDRRNLRDRFSKPKSDPQAIDVLFSSEVGCEGLDYQFCDAMINYDLPWNPMRIEQRIGRIDRYGQRSETVVIYNFVTSGTVDADIYERCLLRLGIFREALGGSEEILGRLSREIQSIAESLNLTPEERADRLQQLSDNEVREIQEQELLEQEQAKFFGLEVQQNDQELVREASSFWLSTEMIINLVEQYLIEKKAIKKLPPLNNKKICTIQVNQEARNEILKCFQRNQTTGAVSQAWRNWLRGGDPYLRLTFDSAAAAQNRDAVFINPTHPLVRQAARTLGDISFKGYGEPKLICNLKVSTSKVAPGRYPFAIYSWRKAGLKNDFSFKIIYLTDEIQRFSLEFMEIAAPGSGEFFLSDEDKALLEQRHHQMWSRERADYKDAQTELINARISSLRTTHNARMAVLKEQLESATDPKIIRMRESQLASAIADFERRNTALEQASERADILTDEIVFGLMVVENEQ